MSRANTSSPSSGGVFIAQAQHRPAGSSGVATASVQSSTRPLPEEDRQEQTVFVPRLPPPCPLSERKRGCLGTKGHSRGAATGPGAAPSPRALWRTPPRGHGPLRPRGSRRPRPRSLAARGSIRRRPGCPPRADRTTRGCDRDSRQAAPATETRAAARPAGSTATRLPRRDARRPSRARRAAWSRGRRREPRRGSTFHFRLRSMTAVFRNHPRPRTPFN